MAMKEWFRRLQPVQLYFMLTLSIAFVLTELVVSHITHALTLLVDSYHMLCNIIALSGCIVTIKYGKDSQTKFKHKTQHEKNIQNSICGGSNGSIGEIISSSDHHRKHQKEQQPSPLLKNTFGWARIDVIVMLICFVFLASLCFSLLVEALQTLVHIEHHDEMHHPIPVLIVGAVGLVLNGICYLLIGGYTFHQGSFLHVTASGDVVLDRVVTKDSVKQGQRRLSRSRNNTTSASTQPSQTDVCKVTGNGSGPDANKCTDKAVKATTTYTKKVNSDELVAHVPSGTSSRQGAREMARDILGCIYVIICSIIVYYTDSSVAKFVDPIVSIISAIHLLWLSYPYMKESGLILLQTMPDTINIDSLKLELLQAFPDIVNIHDLHVWQLTATKIISTAHIIFQDPKVYAKITKEVSDFFIAQGITQVTVQPEFSNISMLRKDYNYVPEIGEDHRCLMRCMGADCTSKHCCAMHMHKDNTKIHKRWASTKEVIPSNSINGLKSIKIHHDEFCPDLPPEGTTNVVAKLHDQEQLSSTSSKEDTTPNTMSTESSNVQNTNDDNDLHKTDSSQTCDVIATTNDKTINVIEKHCDMSDASRHQCQIAQKVSESLSV